MRKLIMIGLVLFAFACNSDEEEMSCYGLNNVQCSFYPWEENLNSNPSSEEKIEAMKGFFQDQDIQVQSASYNPRFYDAVCEACTVCPRSDRYEIELKSSDIPKLESLELKGLTLLQCE